MITIDWKKLLAKRFVVVLLAVIVALAFVMRVQNLDYNSPFYDEALYVVVGNDFLAGTELVNSSFGWVGGLPFFYPVLTALFYRLGGIVGARLLTVLLGTLSVYLLYVFTTHLNLSDHLPRARLEGLFAAFFLAILAIPIYLSRLAIYDMLSFTLFLAGVALLVRTVRCGELYTRRLQGTLGLSAILLFLSFLAKYVTLSLLPFVVLWALVESRRRGQRAAVDVGAFFVLPLMIALVGYGLLALGPLFDFVRGQIPNDDFSAVDVAGGYFPYVVIPLILALAGVFLASSRRTRLLASALVATGLWVPVVHVVSRNSASIHQHAFLSLVFFLPVAALLLYEVVARFRAAGVVAVALISAVTVAWSTVQVRAFDASWPNTAAALSYLQAHVQPGEAILSSDDDVVTLYLSDRQLAEVAGIYYFEYENTTGEPAYRAALEDGYFNWIMISEDSTGLVKEMVAEYVGQRYVVSHEADNYVIYHRQ